MRKKFLKKLLFCLISFFVSFNVYALDINTVLTKEEYSYLPLEAKEYIKDMYDKTGEIVLTEKNKEEGKPYLNPKYISYLTLSESEKEEVGYVPEPLTIDYSSVGRLRSTLPSTYDLRSVNGESYITTLKNQGSLGICWAMTTAEQAESYLMVSSNTPYNSSSMVFSPRQLDYATSTDGINNYTNENGVRPLGEGGNYQMAYFALANGISLVPESIMPFDQSLAKKELYQVLNYANSKYEVEETVGMPKLSDNYTSSEYDSYLEQIKTRIRAYGGAFVGTGSPQGSCGSRNTDGKYIVVDDADCNTGSNPDEYGGHAMQIIGWDDNYNYSYCLSGTNHYNVTSSGTCSIGTLYSGTGAWIVRNSWGNDPNYGYIYLSYRSIKADIGFIVSLKSMSSKDWDNNYHKNPWGSDGSSYYSIIDSASFTKSVSGNEKLVKIKFMSLAQNGTFNISVNNGSQTYSNVATVQTPLPGIYTVDLSSNNISLNSDTFSVTIFSSSFSSMLMGSISVFTSNVSSNPIIETADIDVDLTSNINRAFTVYSSTKNIPSNATVTYKIYKNNVDVSEHFNVVNNIVAENNINAYINVVDYVSSGEYILSTEYNGYSYSSIINITSPTIYVTVTKPDSTTETYEYGYAYNLGTNNIEKANEAGATVTFRYQDNETSDYITNVIKSYTPVGWLVNNVARDNNEILILTENITILGRYEYSFVSPNFIGPTRTNYTFDGWYDEPTGGVRYTSYNGVSNKTFYAHWTYDKPTDFNLNSNLVYLLSGDVHQIIPTFIPAGKTDNLIYSEYDGGVISVTNEGLVTAINPGETTITVALESDESINKTITVKVIAEEIVSDTLNILDISSTKIVIGEEPNTSLSNFKNRFANKELINVYTKAGELVEDNDSIIKTGMKVKLIFNEEELDETTVVIRGDLDENGLVDATDGVIHQNIILEKPEYDSYRLDYRIYAADLDYNPDVTTDIMVDATDGNLLDSKILEKIPSLNN